jgi:hypothetical protein
MTTNFSLAARAAAAVILMVLAAGCAKSADSSATSSTPGSSTTDGATSADGSTSTDGTSTDSNTGASPSEADSTPAQEGTGAESPQPTKKQSPTIKVASLPIGGSADVDGVHQCGRVSLLLQELPPGISISVTSAEPDPLGIFTLGGDRCGSEPPCATWTWTTQTTDGACTVAATQVIDSADSVTLKLAGTVTCPDQSTCDQVQSKLGGSQFQFTALPGVVPSSPSSPSGDTTDGSSDAGGSSSSPAVSGSAEPSTSTEASPTGS